MESDNEDIDTNVSLCPQPKSTGMLTNVVAKAMFSIPSVANTLTQGSLSIDTKVDNDYTYSII